MKILLEKDIYLTSDKYGYIISKEIIRSNNNGIVETSMSHISYHQTIENAIKSFFNKRVRESKVSTIDSLISKIEESTKLIENIFKKVGV